MSSRLRSASLGDIPQPKKHFTSRAESAAAAALDVRCACQFFQSTSLLPERINPIGSRPSSSLDNYSHPSSRNETVNLTHQHSAHSDDDRLDVTELSEFRFGIVGTTDYYAESVSRPHSPVSSVDHTDIIVVDKLIDSDAEVTDFNVQPDELNSSIKQKDPTTSRLVQRKNSKQRLRHNLDYHSDEPARGLGHRSLIDQPKSHAHMKPIYNQTDSMVESPQSPVIMKQRDSSMSRVLQRRLSDQSKSIDETISAVNAQNVIMNQRDPSTSSILRKRLSLKSKSIDESQQSILLGNVIAQRNQSTSSLLRKRLDTQQTINRTDQENIIQSTKSVDESCAEPRKKTGKPIFSRLKKEKTDLQLNDIYDMDKSNGRSDVEVATILGTENKERNNDKNDSGRSILSIFKREPKTIPSNNYQFVDNKQIVSTELTVPAMISAEKYSTQVKQVENFEIIIEPPTPQSLEEIEASIGIIAAQSPILDKKEEIINKEEEKEPTLESVIITINQSNNEKNVIELFEKRVDTDPKTIVAGLFKTVPMSLIGDIIHVTGRNGSRSMSKDPNDGEIKLDTETRLLDHYNKDNYNKDIGVQPPGVQPPGVEEVCHKVPIATTPIDHSIEMQEAKLIHHPELIKRSDIIGGFQDVGQINTSTITPTVSTNVLKQKDPKQSTLLRKRYTQSLDRKQALGRQRSLQKQSSSPIHQKDPTQSTLLEKRRYMSSRGVSHGRAASMDTTYFLPDKISKTVSFEFDKEVKIHELSVNKVAISSKCIQPEANDDLNVTDIEKPCVKTETELPIRDHEYEPIGDPAANGTSTTNLSVDITELKYEPNHSTDNIDNLENTKTEDLTTVGKPKLLRSAEIDEVEMMENVETLQLDLNPQQKQNQKLDAELDKSLSAVPEQSAAVQPDSNSRMSMFLANANHKRKYMNKQIKTQAGKIQTKLKFIKPKTESESPKRTRRKFKRLEFSKLKNIQMPKIKKPEFKRPELTKLKTFERLGSFKKPDFKIIFPDRPIFSKPELPRFNISDRFTSLRLHRSKSVKSTHSESAVTGTTTTDDPPIPKPKKRFDFSTYPRIFDRKKKSKSNVNVDGAGVNSGSGARDDDTTDSRPQLCRMAARVIKKDSPIPTGATTSSFADTESDQFHQQYERESSHSLNKNQMSLERRMQLDKQDSLQSTEEPSKITIQTEEQKQLADYDEENRTIHEISKLREMEFRQRKPFVHQESDLVSEESTKEFGWDDRRIRITNHHDESDSFSQKDDYSTDAIVQSERDHLSVQETQSSGSFKKGVIEEIDDDEFFLRRKGISQDDIQIGQYISSAIREGLDTPQNALAKLGQYDRYYDEDFDVNNARTDYGYDVPPSKPRRVKDFKTINIDRYNDDNDDDDVNVADEDDEFSLRYNDYLQHHDHDELFKTFPPKRPTRKPCKHFSAESLEQNNEVPVAVKYYPHPDEDNGLSFEHDHGEHYDHDNLRCDQTFLAAVVPPRAPKRRKKIKDLEILDKFDPLVIANGYTNEVLLYRHEHEYIVPLAQPEKFSTPTPQASRSRSQVSHITDDDRTSHGADSLAFDDTKFVVNIQANNNGYAVVKKEPPPRPPAPIRRKRSTRSLGDRQLVTMVKHDQNDWDVTPFERTTRNYSTIGPTRPPRRPSEDLDNSQKRLSLSNSDVTQYEEIDDFEKNMDVKNFAHDEILNKMKYRPLPPPPRPPRERKPKKQSPVKNYTNEIDEKILIVSAYAAERSSFEGTEISDTINQLSSQEIEEVEASTQTDPLPDDFICEEFEICDDMKIIEPTNYRKSKTLEDILKEEQQAELERAQQIANEQSLTKSLHKFREANQKSQSERSRGSTTERPKTPGTGGGGEGGSRPITPSSVVIIEKKTVIPTIETDGKLIVQQIADQMHDITSDGEIIHEEDDGKLSEDVMDTEDERIVSEALRRYQFYDDDLRDSSPIFDFTPSQLTTITTLEDSKTVKSGASPIVTLDPSSPVHRDPPTVFTRDLTPPIVRPTENSPPPVPDVNILAKLCEPKLSDKRPIEVAVQGNTDAQRPQPPPRRKSSIPSDIGTLQSNQFISGSEMAPIEECRHSIRSNVFPDPPCELIQSNRMHITDLDVENLNVSCIQASHIAVSELEASAVNSIDLECKSGDLVVKNIQLPPEFLDQIIKRIKDKEDAEKAQNQLNETKTYEILVAQSEMIDTRTDRPVSTSPSPLQDRPPRRPPPPTLPTFDPTEYQAYSIPPPSFLQLRDYDDEIDPPHITASRRRRQHHHYHHRRREQSTTSNDDEYQFQNRPSTMSRSSEPPTVLDLTGQLIRACGRAVAASGSKLIDIIRDRGITKETKIENNREVIIIIIVILVLMMLSLSSDRTIHYHHWDYFNPPDSSATK